MKRFSLLAFLALAAVLFANTPPSPDGSQPGRYQLASGTAPGLKPGDASSTVFRIDTATGKVWMLLPVPLASGSSIANVLTWQECHEINGELYRAATSSWKPKE